MLDNLVVRAGDAFFPLWLPPSFLLRHAQSLYVQTLSTVMRPSNSKYLPAKRVSANSSRSDLKRPNSLFQRSCWQHQTFSGLSPLLGLPSDSLLNIPHGAKNSQKMNLRKNQSNSKLQSFSELSWWYAVNQEWFPTHFQILFWTKFWASGTSDLSFHHWFVLRYSQLFNLQSLVIFKNCYLCWCIKFLLLANSLNLIQSQFILYPIISHQFEVHTETSTLLGTVIPGSSQEPHEKMLLF